MNKKRVVVTGVGVLCPIGSSVKTFTNSLKIGKSGIQKIPLLEEFGFGCLVGGLVDLLTSDYYSYIDKYLLTDASKVLQYSLVTGLEAWNNAQLPFSDSIDNPPNYETGIIVGSSIGTIDMYEKRILPAIQNKNIRRLRSTTVEHSMLNTASAIISGILGLGNWIGFNSSACATGTESIILGYRHIKNDFAKRMLVGGVDIFSPAGWAGFDAMRVTNRNSNDKPYLASRPMSSSASGFVPAEGSGMLVLEEYETAIKRNAPIYAEIIGASINSGGQRNGGTITAPSSKGVIRCIHEAIDEAGIDPFDIDLISGHLSSTMADIMEVQNWSTALNRKGDDFPYINSLKSLTGHCIGAAGAIETIAAVMQLKHQFLHPTLNCEDLHPEIANLISEKKIPHQTKIDVSLQYVTKSSFGFGDTNAILILKRI